MLCYVCADMIAYYTLIIFLKCEIADKIINNQVIWAVNLNIHLDGFGMWLHLK